MALLEIHSPRSGPLNDGMTFLALGFRPFFLFAGLAAVMLVGLWLLVYHGILSTGSYYSPVIWHGHEMVFGYTVAVIAGFLLTAVKNWTGIQTLRYRPLAALVALWLLGRLVPFFSAWVAPWLIALIDFSFLPMLALTLAFPLFKSRQRHNIPFVFVILALSLANALYHLELLGVMAHTQQMGVRVAIDVIVLLLVVMGGRVIPFFIERGLPGVQNRKWPWVERLSIASVLLFVISDVFFPTSVASVVIAFFTSLVQMVRVAGWYHHRIWKVSLLWVLFIGYGWVAIGLLLHAMAALGAMTPFLPLHAFTIGGIGVLTLGMMARVAIGHTGRQMRAHPLMGWAFSLVVTAAVVRVGFPLVWPQHYGVWITLSGTAWLAAFVPFVAIYFPILTRPRVDGQPG